MDSLPTLIFIIITVAILTIASIYLILRYIKRNSFKVGDYVRAKSDENVYVSGFVSKIFKDKHGKKLFGITTKNVFRTLSLDDEITKIKIEDFGTTEYENAKAIKANNPNLRIKINLRQIKKRLSTSKLDK